MTSSRAHWPLLLAAAAILMVTLGVRQSTGLFVIPIDTATGLGIVSISFALAVAQFTWGAMQPVFGALADKFGPLPVVAAGGVLLASGMALTPFMHTEAGLLLTLGILSAAGAAGGSFSILIGATARRLPPERRSFAAGFINAGGSFGQFVFAPLVQAIISAASWSAAMFSVAALSLLTLPLAWILRATPDAPQAAPDSVDAVPLALMAQLKQALRDRSYILLNLGFLTCGFHVAFLVTHLPGEVQLCGLPPAVSATSLGLIGLFNVAGSLAAGALGQRYRMKSLLALMYASRALIIIVYLLSPKTPLTFYLLAAALGFTWLATVPPTAGLVGKLFGTHYLATLFGLTLVSHQVGGFFGAWLGGLALAHFGSYQYMWYADIALATLAALINLPIREAPVRPAAAAA